MITADRALDKAEVFNVFFAFSEDDAPREDGEGSGGEAV